MKKILEALLSYSTFSVLVVSLVGFLCLLDNLSISCDCVEIEPIVTIGQGKLRGKVMTSRQGRKFVAFLGIPYATAVPFALADLPPKWDKTTTRDATKFGDKCLQWDRLKGNVTGSLDCLFINVYTPVYSSPTQTRIPILLYIHGGDWMMGSGNDYDASYFMDEDIVIVTFNYRVGAYGFLTTQDKLLPPNLGLKDQVAALSWVKNNIRNFGGDESRITIFGSGAGGASVSLHLVSPMSRDLFHGAISQSGTALCPWVLRRNPTDVTIQLAQSLDLNCSSANSYTIAACLKRANPHHLIEKQQELAGWNSENLALIPFAPVIESLHSIIDGGPIFLSDSPTKLFREGTFQQQIPWMTGVNSADGITYNTAVILNSTQKLRHVDMNWREIAPLAFTYKETAPNLRQVSQKVRDFYIGPMTRITESNKENLTSALSDRNFFRCAKSAALLYATKSPVWIYYFTFRSNTSSILDSYGIPNNLGLDKVVHSDELQYLFKTPQTLEIRVDSPYFQFSQALVRLWVSFATDGYPRMLWGNGKKWEPLPHNEIKPESLIKMYNIDENTEMIDEPFYHRLAFWDKLRLRNPFPPRISANTPNYNEQDESGDNHHNHHHHHNSQDNHNNDYSREPFDMSGSGILSLCCRSHLHLIQLILLLLYPSASAHTKLLLFGAVSFSFILF